MTHIDDFLSAFSAIEKGLRSKLRALPRVTFYELVERAAERDAKVRRLRDDLKEFADLRNAIVHERTDGHAIADPNARAVRDIRRLQDLLLAPPAVMPAFARHILRVGLRAPIGEVAADMTKHSYSQVPVTDGGRCVGLLTTNTIARWLGANAAEDLVSLRDTSVADVMEHTESKDNYRIVGRGESQFDVLALFQDFEGRGKRLEAVLISDAGKAEQALLGIITLYEMPTLIRNTGLRQ